MEAFSFKGVDYSKEAAEKRSKEQVERERGKAKRQQTEYFHRKLKNRNKIFFI